MQTKATASYRLTPVRMTVTNTQGVWWGCGEKGPACAVGGTASRCGDGAASMRGLQQLRTGAPSDPATPPLSIYLETTETLT